MWTRLDYLASNAFSIPTVVNDNAVGMYHHRSQAAHWDGKNALGESVASGVYFYTFKAGKYSATRKMLIRK